MIILNLYYFFYLCPAKLWVFVFIKTKYYFPLFHQGLQMVYLDYAYYRTVLWIQWPEFERNFSFKKYLFYRTGYLGHSNRVSGWCLGKTKLPANRLYHISRRIHLLFFFLHFRCFSHSRNSIGNRAKPGIRCGFCPTLRYHVTL